MRVGIAQANGQLAQLGRVARQQMRLQVEHDLQAMLDLAQESVVLFQQRPFLMRQAAARSPTARSLPACCRCAGRQIAAVEQLQELDDEFDVANAAVAGLDIVAVGPFAVRALLDAALEGLDARDVGPAEIAAIDPRFELVEKLAAQVQVAGDRAGL